MKITEEQRLMFSLQYNVEVNRLVKALCNDKKRLQEVMNEFDFSDAFDFKRFARTALFDHMKTYKDEESALDTVKDIVNIP